MSNCPEGYFDAGKKSDDKGTIDDWSCHGDLSITKLWIPSSVTSIGSNAFSECANLTEIEFEEGGSKPLSFGLMSFARCTALSIIRLPARTTGIGKGCFRDCTDLEEIEIGEGRFPLRVSDHLFDNCCEYAVLAETIGREVDRRSTLQSQRVEKTSGIRTGAEGEGKSEGDMERTESFNAFWLDFVGWWGMNGDGEEITLKQGRKEYVLRCCWDEGILLVAMVAPWPQEWDYAQLYKGMFGWDDVGEGFHSRTLRKKVAKLLLVEIIRRVDWLRENPEAVAQRDAELHADCVKAEGAFRKIESKFSLLKERKIKLTDDAYDKAMPSVEGSFNRAKGEYDAASHDWFAKYRWTRNRMAMPGEGDMRLYVKGVNHLWGAPIQCQWARADM